MLTNMHMIKVDSYTFFSPVNLRLRTTGDNNSSQRETESLNWLLVSQSDVICKNTNTFSSSRSPSYY